MKFLCKLGSCCGGATVTPAAETPTSSSSSFLLEGGLRRRVNSHAVAPGGLRKVKSTSNSRLWKPTLNMISEDSTAIASERIGSDTELSAQVNAKYRGKVKKVCRGADYWNSSMLWALPAYSPSPFMI